MFMTQAAITSLILADKECVTPIRMAFPGAHFAVEAERQSLAATKEENRNKKTQTAVPCASSAERRE